MTKRERLELKKEKNFALIEEIRRENIELTKELYLLSDEKQWFREEVESHPKQPYQRKPHFLDGKLVGRICWNDVFKDEDSGETVTIERSEVVRVNGVWI